MLLVVLAEVSAAYYLFGASFLFTLIHTADEVFAGPGSPFWDYYRAHFGRGLNDLIGTLLFVGLALTLWGLAVGGYLCGSELLLGGLIGARVGDAVISHFGLRLRFSGPNPGLSSAPLYVLESVAALWALPVSGLGFSLGAGAFAVFWLLSFLFPKELK